jgi:hydroxymethylpyrimidine pyrophosphatase-like HAD family hydrolase
MSADNTILIVRTRSKDNNFQWHVCHVQNDDSLTYEPDFPKDNPEINMEYFKDYFQNAPVFDNEDAAIKYAFKLYNSIKIVEYGVCSEDFDFICPEDIGKKI